MEQELFLTLARHYPEEPLKRFAGFRTVRRWGDVIVVNHCNKEYYYEVKVENGTHVAKVGKNPKEVNDFLRLVLSTDYYKDVALT